MPSTVKASALAFTLVAFLATSACRREARDNPSPAPAPGPDLPAAPGGAARWSPEQVFRRAFWRQPSADDRILEALREETPAAAGVQSWRWALALHPGPDLLAAIRNPETFGLLPAANPRPWTDTPAWFPTAAGPGFEVLQAPSGRFTVLYRAADNLLYATDAGRGFAPPTQ